MMGKDNNNKIVSFFLLIFLFSISYDVCFGTKCVSLSELPDFKSIGLPLPQRDSIWEFSSLLQLYFQFPATQ